MTNDTLDHPRNRPPASFTREELGWFPWLVPLGEADLDERHLAGLVDRARAKSDYFRLLVHDPEVLEARTRLDKDVFYNGEGGLPRGLREFAATIVSRTNGCIFCASVHARFAARLTKREDLVDRLLADGERAEFADDWALVARAARALAATPVDEEALREALENLFEAGGDDLSAIDLVQAAAFFNWANRLMLSLGEPSSSSAS